MPPKTKKFKKETKLYLTFSASGGNVVMTSQHDMKVPDVNRTNFFYELNSIMTVAQAKDVAEMLQCAISDAEDGNAGLQ